MSDESAVPNKPIPVVKWDTLGRVREPTDAARKASRSRARARVAASRQVGKFLDDADGPVQGSCCDLAAVFASHFPDHYEGSCCDQNAAAVLMLQAAGRWKL